MEQKSWYELGYSVWCPAINILNCIVYFDQLLGAARTQKLHPEACRTAFLNLFSTFFVNFKPFFVISRLKSTKTSENEQKTYVPSKLSIFSPITVNLKQTNWKKKTKLKNLENEKTKKLPFTSSFGTEIIFF